MKRKKKKNKKKMTKQSSSPATYQDAAVEDKVLDIDTVHHQAE